MRVHSNTTTIEFLNELRDAAIRAGQPSQVIDAIDRLYDLDDMESELAKAGDETYQAELDRDDLFEELEYLVKAIDENLDPDKEPKAITDAMKMARAALERHSS